MNLFLIKVRSVAMIPVAAESFPMVSSHNPERSSLKSLVVDDLRQLGEPVINARQLCVVVLDPLNHLLGSGYVQGYTLAQSILVCAPCRGFPVFEAQSVTFRDVSIVRFEVAARLPCRFQVIGVDVLRVLPLMNVKEVNPEEESSRWRFSSQPRRRMIENAFCRAIEALANGMGVKGFETRAETVQERYAREPCRSESSVGQDTGERNRSGPELGAVDREAMLARELTREDGRVTRCGVRR